MNINKEPENDNSQILFLTRQEIFCIIKENVPFLASKVACEKLETHLSQILHSSYTLSTSEKRHVQRLFSTMRQKWIKARRDWKRFLNHNSEWLKKKVAFNQNQIKTTEIIINDQNISHTTLETVSVTSEKCDEITTEKIRSEFSSEEALSLIVDNKLTRNQYEGLREVSLRHNCKLYPSYKEVLNAKKKSYPGKSSFIFTETSAKVELQDLLDHTVNRILMMKLDLIQSFSSERIDNLHLVCKWISDDGNFKSRRHQQSTNADTRETDANILLIYLIPLELVAIREGFENLIIWNNVKSFSQQFFRPIKIDFSRQKDDIEEIKRKQSQIVPFTTIKNGKEIMVSYDLTLITLDNEIPHEINCDNCNAILNQDFQSSSSIKKRFSQQVFTNRLLWIHFLECCLNISVSLEVKKFPTQDEREMLKIEMRRKNIEKGFHQQLGIILSELLKNDNICENTAKQFFKNFSTSASITGLNKDLIKRFFVILQTISSGYEINLMKFKEYTLKTARQFFALYPWFFLPDSIHQLLVHSDEFLNTILLSTGQMKENVWKTYKKYQRDCNSERRRKKKKKKMMMENLFLHLLVSSDPCISSFGRMRHKELKSLPVETIQLLRLSDDLRTSFRTDLSDSATDDSTDDDV